MNFYWLEQVKTSRYSGEYNAANKWKLPGVRCPLCGASWGGAGIAYPCVDLSSLPERTKLEKARLEENFEEYERLRELVRPLAPPGALLEPGTYFGPRVGTARGKFGPLTMQYDFVLLIRPEVLAQLQAKGVRGLKGCLTDLRFRQKPAPELLELQLMPYGLLHRDCLPPGKDVPCAKCGRRGFSRPAEPILDKSSLPKDFDLFRLANFPTMVICTEHFTDAARCLGLEDLGFLELPLR